MRSGRSRNGRTDCCGAGVAADGQATREPLAHTRRRANTLIWPYWRKHQYEHVVPLAEERVAIYRSLAATTAGQENKLCHREALDTLGRTLHLLQMARQLELGTVDVSTLRRSVTASGRFQLAAQLVPLT